MRRLALVLLIALVAAVAGAQSISYTVQVIAVSDQSQAFALIRELGLAGFPAYATRATTEQGDVLRVRVGGFANRAAALIYADAMPDLPMLGSRPLPALAESIPPGLMPFEPRVLLDVREAALTLLAWGDTVAARLASVEGHDTYVLFSDGSTVQFPAWAAWRDEDGLVLRLRDMPLWPDGWEDDPDEVRAAQQDARVELVASRLELPVELVAGAVREREDGPPVLVVYERFNPWLSLEVGQLLAVSVAAADGAAVAGELHGFETEPPEEGVLLEAEIDLPGVAVVEGDGWTIVFDDPWMVQRIAGNDRGWRAAVGEPLWSERGMILARHGERLLLYDFVAR